MNDLPNGFTGYADVDPDFESAADALRRQRAEVPSYAPEHAPAQVPASDGTFQYGRDVDSGRRVETELPFDMEHIDDIDPIDQRWAWAEIDLSAVRHNIAETRRCLRPRTRMMAVVKADACGHGAPEIARAALGAGADRLGVATVPEALALRKAGIDASIMLFSQPPATSIPLLLAYHITPSVYEPDFAVAYGEAADLHGVRAPYHLAMNTGMNRIGVRHDSVVEFMNHVSFHRALDLEGVYTHYATADCPETLDFNIQTNRFIDAVDAMRNAGYDPGIVHSANSPAVFRYPDVHFDMVRLGLVLYGFHPCPETHGMVDFRPVMSVHARITDTRFVPMSEGVSYGLHYRSPGSVKICTIPLGYADGLRRGLSGNIDVIMNGRYYRQVGNICMDQCMFEVDMRSTAAHDRIDPKTGDEVIVVGAQGIAEVTIEEMAMKLGTVPQEVAIGFGHRLSRVYK